MFMDILPEVKMDLSLFLKSSRYYSGRFYCKTIESCRLEKTSDIKSNHKHDPAKSSTKPCPRVPHLHVF